VTSDMGLSITKSNSGIIDITVNTILEVTNILKAHAIPIMLPDNENRTLSSQDKAKFSGRNLSGSRMKY
jgi:hypothetical protein